MLKASAIICAAWQTSISSRRVSASLACQNIRPRDNAVQQLVVVIIYKVGDLNLKLCGEIVALYVHGICSLDGSNNSPAYVVCVKSVLW